MEATRRAYSLGFCFSTFQADNIQCATIDNVLTECALDVVYGRYTGEE